jgi:hypothetical protein
MPAANYTPYPPFEITRPIGGESLVELFAEAPDGTRTSIFLAAQNGGFGSVSAHVSGAGGFDATIGDTNGHSAFLRTPPAVGGRSISGKGIFVFTASGASAGVFVPLAGVVSASGTASADVAPGEPIVIQAQQNIGGVTFVGFTLTGAAITRNVPFNYVVWED